MTLSNTMPVPANVNDPICPDKPIVYYYWLEKTFAGWAADVGVPSRRLRNVTESAIRHRHHEAIIDHPCHRARSCQPNIYTLGLGIADVFYTVEPHAVVKRGYGWTPDENGDGGDLYRGPWQ